VAVRLSSRLAGLTAAISVVLTAPCAAQTTFSNPASITIADGATPPTKAVAYPSSISVSGFSGQVVGKLTVTLTGFGQTYPSDVDILLVGPTGQSLVLLSDVGGTTAVSGLTLTFDDAAASDLPDPGPLVSGSFRPTNVGAGDAFPAPAPAPSGALSLTAFNGTDPNGTWSLYVVDDTAGGAGTIAGGWSLTITPAQQFSAASVTIADSLTPPAKASPYPSTIRVTGAGTTLNALAVTLSGLNHRAPDDIDVLLVGPTGAKALIMSDVGGIQWAMNVTLTLEDAAASSMPDSGQLFTASYKPTNFDAIGPDSFPAPAPAPSGSALSVFNGTDPNGIWSLYIVDDTSTDGGSITGWTLTMQTSGAVPTTTTVTTTTTTTTTTTATTATTTTSLGASTTTSVTATSTSSVTTSTASTTTASTTSTTTSATTTMSTTSTTSAASTTTSTSTTTTSNAASTTTTVSSPTSTTITIDPRGVERAAPLAGTLLKIRDAANIAKRSLLVLARDRTIALAHDLSGAADPTLHGARLRVWSDAAFDASYDLPAGGWRVIGTSARPRGYRYDDPRGVAGPVRSVVVKDGVVLKITARRMPDVSLATAPDPVGVTLTSGDLVYCLSFGGSVKFSSGRSFVAKNAPLTPCP
jgi:hypothetical protein